MPNLFNRLLTPILMMGLSAAAEAFMRANPEAFFATEAHDDEPDQKTDPGEFLESYSKFITEYYGPRCAAVEPGCRVCLHWKIFELFKMTLD